MKTTKRQPLPPLPVSPQSRPGAEPVYGDVAIYAGVAAATLIIEASDLEGVVKIRTEIALDEYDQAQVDRFTARWRAKMDRKCRQRFAGDKADTLLHIVP